jgi:hypothetical protein
MVNAWRFAAPLSFGLHDVCCSTSHSGWLSGRSCSSAFRRENADVACCDYDGRLRNTKSGDPCAGTNSSVCGVAVAERDGSRVDVPSANDTLRPFDDNGWPLRNDARRDVVGSSESFDWLNCLDDMELLFFVVVVSFTVPCPVPFLFVAFSSS